MTAADLTDSFVAVTGGHGAIGRRVCATLLTHGARVRAFDTQAAPTGSAWESIQGSILDPVAVEEAVVGCTAVVHLAAQTVASRCARQLAACLALNVLGTGNAIEACASRRIRHLVFASTAYVYGRPAHAPVDETAMVSPLSAYAASKAAAELVLMTGGEVRVPVSILRLANVYGPGFTRESLLSGLVASVSASGDCSYRSGGAIRDFVFVDDVAETIVRILAAGPPRAGVEVLNVGTGVSRPVREVVDCLQGVVESRGYARPAVRETAPDEHQEVPALILDIAALTRRLGWCPSTSLVDGLHRMLDAEGLAAK